MSSISSEITIPDESTPLTSQTTPQQIQTRPSPPVPVPIPLQLPTCLKTKEENITQARKILYLSHVFAKFSEIGWQFCLILFLTALTNYNSLIFVSTYGLFTGVSSCLFGSMVGAIVDDKERDRLSMARMFIWCQNSSVFVATFCCFWLLRYFSYTNDIDSDAAINSNINMEMDSSTTTATTTTNFHHLFAQVMPSTNQILWALLLLAVHIFGGLAQVLDQGFTVAIERDWIVEMSHYYCTLDENANDEECTCGDNTAESHQTNQTNRSEATFKSAGMNSNIIEKMRQEQWLSQTNTTMTQIDLGCKVLAPAASGIFIECYERANQSDYLEAELAYAALIVGLLNMVSLYVEYTCSKKIYDLIPPLRVRRRVESAGVSVTAEVEKSGVDSGKGHVSKDETAEQCFFCLPTGLSIYLRQPVTYAGIALALLYFNVLTFGGLMTAYLVSKGMDFDTIGIWRGVSCVIGICGTLYFHIFSKFRSLSVIGMRSLIFQFTCLLLSWCSLFVNNRNLSFTMLIAGVCSSRMGLWAFDLTAKQLFQQYIPEDVRGVVGGVQSSLNALLGLGSFILGMIYSDPNQFGILMTVSFCNIGAATIFYFFGVYLRQESL